VSFETSENTIIYGLKEMRMDYMGFVNSGNIFLLVTKICHRKKWITVKFRGLATLCRKLIPQELAGDKPGSPKWVWNSPLDLIREMCFRIGKMDVLLLFASHALSYNRFLISLSLTHSLYHERILSVRERDRTICSVSQLHK